MKLADVSTILGYGMAALMGIMGILVLSGFIVPGSMPVQLRILFGIVLILYSVFRFMMTRTRSKQAESSEE